MSAATNPIAKEPALTPVPLLSRPFFHLLLLTIVGLFAYSNTLHVPFVFDDMSSIVDNPAIRDLPRFLSGEGRAFNPRRVVGYFTFAVNYRLGGLDPTGYHVVNIAVHILSGWMVYLLLRLTLATPFFGPGERQQALALAPLFAALLFVAHPVQTQAVTYTVQRLASLVTLFYLLTLFCYAKGRLALVGAGAAGSGEARALDYRRSALFFLGALFFAFLAIQTKEVAATLPLALLLYEFCFFEPGRKRNLILFSGLLVFALLAAAAVVQAGKPLGELLSDVNELSRETRSISRGEYLLTQFSVIATYLRLLLLPVNQNLDYDYPVYDSIFAPQVFLSLFLLSALFAAALWRQRSSSRAGFGNAASASGEEREKAGLGRLIAFGVFWFFITLSVESSVIPISDVIFEHRLYLPAVGAFTAMAAAAALLFRKARERSVMAGFFVVVLLLAAATWQRNKVWESPVSLWGDVVSKSPAKSRANDHYGVALSEVGRTGEAIEFLKAALQIDPRNVYALYNLGRLLDEINSIDAAINCYEAAAGLQPDLYVAYNNLAVDYLLKGDNDRAIQYCNMVLKYKPRFAEARNNLGFALLRKGKLDQAIEQYQAAVRENPAYAKAHGNLGEAYMKKGDADMAVGAFQQALRLKPEDAVTRENLARALQATAAGGATGERSVQLAD